MKLICQHGFVADTFWTRFKGLLGRGSLAEEEGLLIRPCHSVHTAWMKFAIDVVFLTHDGRVVAFHEELAPFRVSRVYAEAKMVLELPAGRIRKTGIEVGDQLNISLE
jgi:uncharacterized membrane protein (UPF0127 family)